MHFSSLIEVCKARSQLGRIKLFLCAGAACLAMIGPAAAQPQSNSSIRLIVPFPAGGGPDLIARTIAPGLAERMGKNVIVDNRPGSGGIIGTLAGAQAAPDGLTITFGSTSSYAAGPALNKSNVRYDATRDFIHIGMIGRVPVVLIVKAECWLSWEWICATPTRRDIPRFCVH
jgi:tripartite-type tricarboxylate transporter receptor subunit TctC